MNPSLFKKMIPLVLLSLNPLAAFASLGNNAIANGLDNLIDLITGEVGTSLCTLAIIGVGFLWLKLGKLEKEQALAVIIGIGVIYSASWLAAEFGA